MGEAIGKGGRAEPERADAAPVAAYALAVALTSLAGFVDATGYIRFHHVFVSFMSGNSTQAMVAASGGDLPFFAVIGRTILLFVVGVTLGELLAATSRRWGRPLVLLAEVTLLAAALAFARVGWSGGWTTSALALATGTQNAAVHRAEGISVALTYVTGTLVHVGRGVAAALRQTAPWRAILPFLGLWIGLVAGGFVGATVASRSLQLALAVALGAGSVLLLGTLAAAALAPGTEPG